MSLVPSFSLGDRYPVLMLFYFGTSPRRTGDGEAKLSSVGERVRVVWASLPHVNFQLAGTTSIIPQTT